MAVPALGCGNGGLDWDTVRPLIEEAFAALPEVRVLLYDPLAIEAAPARQPHPGRTKGLAPRRAGANGGQPLPVPAAHPVHREPPAPDDERLASLLYLIGRYGELGYELSWREVARLADLLHAADAPRAITDTADHDPRPTGVTALRSQLAPWLEGGPARQPTPAALRLRPEAAAAAQQALKGRPDAWAHAQRVARLMEGFESPYGLELLVMVHHLAREQPEVATDAARAVTETIARFGRERRYLQPNHVWKAWQRLHEQGWLSRAALTAPAR